MQRAPRPPPDLRLEGAAVALVPVAPAHAAALFPLVHGRDEVLRWLLWRGPATLAELRESYASWCEAGPHGTSVHLAVLDRTAGESPVGTIGLRYLGPGVGDVGYWIGSEHWGRGLATEAVRLLATYAFAEQGAAALCAWVDVGNAASRRVLEKNDFVLQRTVPAKIHKQSGPVDQWGFVRSREAAPARADRAG